MSNKLIDMPDSDQTERRVFAENLQRFLETHRVSQVELANAIGRSPSSVNNWVKAIAMPPHHDVRKVAEFFGAQPDDLYLPPTAYSVRQSVRIPVVDEYGFDEKTGEPTKISEFAEIPNSWTKNKEYFGLKITSNMYIPRILKDDVLIVWKTEHLQNLDKLYVFLEYGSAVLRRYVQQESGFLLVSPYPTIRQNDCHLLRQDVRYYDGILARNEDRVRMLGRVEFLYGKM